jgi:uncharacterized membrane protein YgdD (TMEM256/DUF423 family)
LNRWSATLVTIAGLMGASGVGLAAWSSHRGGGDILMTAALFLILHGGCVAAIAIASGRAALLIAVSALAVGTILFSGDLALLSIWGLKPIPLAAPTGGMGMILGWLWLAATGAIAAVQGYRE